MPNEIKLGQLDFEFFIGIWDRGVYPPNLLTDYYRVKVFTKRLADYIKEKTGKKIPLRKIIALTEDEYHALHDMISESKKFTGLIGDAEPKNFDWERYYWKDERFPITDEYNDYDLTYNEL